MGINKQTILKIAGTTSLDIDQKKQALSNYFSCITLGLQRGYLKKEDYLIGRSTVPFELLTHQNDEVSALYLHLLVLAKEAHCIAPLDIIMVFSGHDAKGINIFLSYLLNAEGVHLGNVQEQITGWMIKQIYKLRLFHKLGLIDKATFLKCIIGSDDMPFLLFSGLEEVFTARYVQCLTSLSVKRVIAQDDLLQVFSRNLLPRLLEKNISVCAFYHAMKCLNRLLIKNCMQPDRYKNIILDPKLPMGSLLPYFLSDAPPVNYRPNFGLYLDGLRVLFKAGLLSRVEYIGLFTQKDCSGLTVMQQLLNLENSEFIKWFLNGVEKMQPFELSPEENKALFFSKQAYDFFQPIFRDNRKKEADTVNASLDVIRKISSIDFVLELSEENFFELTKRQCFFKSISSTHLSVTESTRLGRYSPNTVSELGF